MNDPHGTGIEATLLRFPPVLMPAAGASTRFGAPKLLEPVDGVPIIRRTVDSLRAGGAGYLLVTVHPGERSLAPAIDPLPGFGLFENPQWEEGMASSYRLLARCVSPDVAFVLACPADLPWLRGDTVAKVIEAARGNPGRLVVPSYRGQAGHPVAIPRALLDRAGELSGDEGFRRWRDSAVTVEVDDPGAVRDVDIPGDLLSP